LLPELTTDEWPFGFGPTNWEPLIRTLRYMVLREFTTSFRRLDCRESMGLAKVAYDGLSPADKGLRAWADLMGFSPQEAVEAISLVLDGWRRNRTVYVHGDPIYSHYHAKRLPAEVLLDAYSQVTGVPTPFTHLNTNAHDATIAYSGFPLGTRAMQLPDSLVTSNFLDAFGRPERSQTCSCERSQDSSVGQALHRNNGKTLNDKLRARTSRVGRWLREKVPDDEAVQRLYLLALCREPTGAERARFRKFLAEAVADKQSSRQEALEDLFWAVLASREFVFNR